MNDPMTVEQALAELRECCLDLDGSELPSRAEPYSCDVGLLRAAANHITTLAAQVEALQSSLSQLYGAKFSDRCYQALKSRAEVAEGQVDALRANDARYRWLREKIGQGDDCCDVLVSVEWVSDSDSLDAAIDANPAGREGGHG